MDVLRIVSPVLGANCYVLCPNSHQAVVVDPGAQTYERIRELLTQLHAELGAILLTHGHADHLWDAAKVSKINPEAPIYLAALDHFWLEPPGPAVRLGMDSVFSSSDPWEPIDVQPPPEQLFTAGGASIVNGLKLQALPAPGHSPGSTMFFGQDTIKDHGQGLVFSNSVRQAFCLSGDVVFQGSVGRSDLPKSDPEQMTETLRMLTLSVDPATLFLPGHGSTTRFETELQTNPFLNTLRKV